MKNLDFTVTELEELEAPGIGEILAGFGATLALGAAGYGIGLLIT